MTTVTLNTTNKETTSAGAGVSRGHTLYNTYIFPSAELSINSKKESK